MSTTHVFPACTCPCAARIASCAVAWWIGRTDNEPVEPPVEEVAVELPEEPKLSDAVKVLAGLDGLKYERRDHMDAILIRDLH